MHRRQFLRAATIATAASPVVRNTSRARQSTPAATPATGEGTLAERVARVDPAALLEALLTTPLTTPLFPADTPPVEPVPWEDTGDVDLANAVGGVVFNTGYDGNDNFLAVGTAIVHPDAGSATAAFTGIGPPTKETFLGMPWFVQAVTDDAVSVLQVGYLLLVGGAESPIHDPADGSPMALRAITHMVALLDHLDGVLSGIGA